MPVVEPVACYGVTLRVESSSGSYTSRVSRRGDALSTSEGDTGTFDEDPTEQRAMRARVQAQRYGGLPMVVDRPIEDNIDEDPEKDSLSTDDYVSHDYMSKLVDPEDFDLWDEPASV
ncbi:hypothetical protein FNV43_RR01994 [Rhamnella rubrinervis]|uniref:Uncharacterized protein n=1 Tax=Rhamnella rubrinervis TaxID=2594499 RepID=A0A8K0HQN3_9ROSA|nr:hypothetical protein FNV43_RR01994 [Rhamnella rubrinervis]